MFAYELQRRFEKAGIKTLSVAAHPGLSSTDLVRHIPLPKFIASILVNTIGLFLAQSAEDGSKPTLMAATDNDVHGGEYYGPRGFNELKGKVGKVSSTDLSHDKVLASKLWDLSEKLTGFKYGI
jgi:hypothetical protein